MQYYTSNDSHDILIREAQPSEAPLIADLYKTISVNDGNYREKLSADSEQSFARRGGMFEISDTSDILKRITDTKEKVTVGLFDGDICSMLWYGRWQGELPELIPNDAGKEWSPKIRELYKEGKLGYSKEIISVTTEASGVMPFALFANMMADYANDGVTHTVGDVFRVDGYRDAEGFHETELLNNASFHFLEKSGGIHLGCLKQKAVTIDSFDVYITPYAFIWDTAKSYDTIIKILNNKGWETNDG